MIVLPAPGSSASRNRSGVRGSSSPYTARIWCGSGCTSLVATASIGSNRPASVMRCASATSLKSLAVASKARLPLCATRELVLVLAEHDLLAEAAGGVLVGQLERVRAVPLRGDDRDDLGGDEPVDPQTGLQLLKLHE